MIRASLLFAGEQYKGWLLNPRILLIVYLIVFLNQSITVKMISLCKETGYGINIAEPLALIFSKNVFTVIIPVVFIALMSDFPKTHGKIFYICRMSRRGWIIGELIFSVMSSLTYIFAMIFGIFLFSVGSCSFSNEWSEYTTNFYIEYPKLYEQNTVLMLEPSVYTQGKPMEVLVHSVLLIFLYTLLISQIIMLFKLLNTGEAGVMLSAAITCMGLASDSGASPAGWFFPITHTVFGWHFNAFFRKEFFPLYGSYVYLTLLICLLLAANFTVSRRVRL